jgi:hypothetical protein
MSKKIVKNGFVSPFVESVISNIYEKPVELTDADVLDQIKCLFEEEGDFYAGTYLAGLIKLEVPTDWHEKCLEKAISAGNYYNAMSVLSVLNRPLSEKEVPTLIKQVILTGDMKALHEIEKFSNVSFHLAIWQHIMLIRTVRLLWEKKFSKKSELSTMLSFYDDFASQIAEFSEEVISYYYFKLIDYTFPCFDQNTMAQVLHQLLSLDREPLIKKLATNIKNNSALG